MLDVLAYKRGFLGLVTLGWYAVFNRKLKTIEKARTIKTRRLGVQILVDSYLDEHVDRSECLLRIRVLSMLILLRGHPDQKLARFDEISDVILIDAFWRSASADGFFDASRARCGERQLLQIHEAELKSELELLKEWLDK